MYIRNASTSARSRREFLKRTPLFGLAAASLRAGPGPLPAVRLGGLQVSRLILGSNPFFGFAHKPDETGRLMREYYTDDRIMAVLDEAAEHGITAVWTPVYDRWISLWNRYRQNGGKLNIWIGQPDPKNPEDMKPAITACARNGGRAVCIQGERIDAQVRAGRWDVIRDWVEHIKSHGLPAGFASHRPETHLIAEKKGMPTDFYHQCVYQPENYSAECWEQAINTITQLRKPVMAYKVLAAGRIAPAEALPKLWRALGPKDGLCIGMFPKEQPEQIAEDTALVRRLSARG
jgi:hypothetical protein